jgi:hypothetical protein
MLKNGFLSRAKAGSAVLVIVVLCCIASVWADRRAGWEHKQVDWRMTGGARIKQIIYPPDKPVPTLARRKSSRPQVRRRRLLSSEAASRPAPLTETPPNPVMVSVINSPPIDGFVPWIVVAVTDGRLGDFELDAIPSSSVVGNYLPTADPQSDYTIGLFDTGAGVHVMGSADAYRAGVFDAGLTTWNTVVVSGVTGEVDAWISYPLGVFIDGLGALENGLLLDTSEMVGETNVSIVVGDPIESPYLPTVIGAPLSVYFTAAFRNDRHITVVRDANEFISPEIRFYENSDPRIPEYSNTIHLQLRPTGGLAVQYIPNFVEPYEPLIPSTITAFLPSQSLFFLSSVDLAHGSQSTIDRQGFMFDTGAQVTVISEAIAARLRLNPNNPDFEVVILDVTGDVTVMPGFYIDELTIPALGEWLEFTHVPVIMLDAPSPEGGTLDGIIGMNLFLEFNFVFRGGGLPDMGGHRIEFEPVPYHIVADIAPLGGDGVVDFLDLALFAEAWLANTMSPNWDSRADMIGDAEINFLDFTVLADYWREGEAERIIGDIAPDRGDGVVDFLDLALLVDTWLADPETANWNPRADLISDSEINLLDYTLLAQHWRETNAP